jgi:uncharacterized protein (DUF2147 family)
MDDQHLIARISRIPAGRRRRGSRLARNLPFRLAFQACAPLATLPPWRRVERVFAMLKPSRPVIGRIAALALFALAGLAAPATGLAQALSPVGQWELANGDSRYRVSFCEGRKLCAKLVWLHPRLRTPENIGLLNTYILRGAEPAQDRVWSGEVTFEGRSYQGTVTLVSGQTIRVNACSGLLCQSFELHKRLA